MCDGYDGKVAVVLVNYNGKIYINQCLDSIFRQTYTNIAVIVVDNCSTDNSPDMIEKSYPNVCLIRNNENTGFARGNNIGIEYAIRQGADYILLLNIDTWIDNNMIGYLVQNASSSIVTVPKIYCDRRMSKIWYAGGEIDYHNGNAYHCAYKDFQETRKVSFACGCCALIHTDIFKQIGMFDEKCYLYFEDVDLSFRMLEAGKEIFLVQEAKMWHKIGGTGGRNASLLKNYYMIRNRLYFIKKHAKAFQTGYFRTSFKLLWKNVISEYSAEKRKYAWRGIADFYLGRMYMYKDK